MNEKALKELADWMIRYGAEFHYTINDDGTHISFRDYDEDFVFWGSSEDIIEKLRQ